MMIELPFGSVAPAWPGVPLGPWNQTAAAMNRPVALQPLQVPNVQSVPVSRSPQLFNPSTEPYGIGGQTGLPFVSAPLALTSGYPEFFAEPRLTIPGLLMAVALRRGQPNGPTTDQEIEDFMFDVFELLPGTSDVEIRCENGKATLTGSVHHKRLKHDIGEIAWAMPMINDVQNNLTITTRRRTRPGSREAESQPGPTRKQA